MAKQQTDSKAKSSGEGFSLPASSFDEVKKIIQGYAGRGEAKSLSDVNRLTGVSETMISRNNGFLTETGLITEGKTKNATDLGKKLGRAFEFNRTDEIEDALRTIVQETAFLADLPSFIRVKGGVTHDDLSKHILFASESTNNKFKVAGANAVVQLLIEANLINDDNGTLRVNSSNGAPKAATSNSDGQPKDASNNDDQSKATSESAAPSTSASSAPNISLPTGINPVAIAINIQLQLPETDNPTVYENLFKALKAHLLNA